MRLGDLLIAAKLVTMEQVGEALARQVGSGGRLGENLVAIGAITHEALDTFLHRVPVEPGDIAATGIDETTLLSLLIKLVYTNRLETPVQMAEAIRLPVHIVTELVRMAVERRLLRSLGNRDNAVVFSPSSTAYAITDEGARVAQEALQHSQYVGPAPVTLTDFVQMVHLQKINNVVVTHEKIRNAFGELAISDVFIEKLGPALNSGRAILMYGPPGNGKTSVALCFASLFNDVIYIPQAVMISGQIMRVYDPSVHVKLNLEPEKQPGSRSLIRAEESDGRWVPCQRPFIVTGGELTLEMLDLRYDAAANFYEAPLQVKALGGCFVIDDFGRQLVSPTSLLNRWIIPMENKVDYLKLHTGKSFSLPFEELLIFSTNLEPEDLMDPAFLRRLPYKLEVGAPGVKLFHRIFSQLCERQGLGLSDDIFNGIVQKITDGKGLQLAAYQPKFIVDQIVATCRFMGVPPHFEPRFIDYAVDNLRVNRSHAPSHTERGSTG
jgi:hypothetical protein